MAYTFRYERSKHRGSGQACMTSLLFLFLALANFQRSRLVTARSWWIHPSLDPNLRHWSRIISSMGRTGSRCNAIIFSSPRKPIQWVASSGYLTGKSFQRDFEDNGADIACCGESRPRFECLAGSEPHCANLLSPKHFGQRSPERRALKLRLWRTDLWNTSHGPLTQNGADFQLQDICPPNLSTHLARTLIARTPTPRLSYSKVCLQPNPPQLNVLFYLRMVLIISFDRAGNSTDPFGYQDSALR